MSLEEFDSKLFAFSLCTTALSTSLDTVCMHFRGEIELRDRHITQMDWV